MPATELKVLEDTPKAFDAALSAANFRPLVFNLKVAEDTYNDETRIKKSVNRFVPLSNLHQVIRTLMLRLRPCRVQQACCRSTEQCLL